MMIERSNSNDMRMMAEMSLNCASSTTMEEILEALRKSDGNTSTIRSLLGQALTHPEIYVGFVEWLPLVKEDPISWNTCRLFAFGTYNDYRNSVDGFYFKLTESQMTKLKALSIITIVHQQKQQQLQQKNVSGNKSRFRRRNANKSDEDKNYLAVIRQQQSVVVPYALLRQELEIDDIHDLEDLIIDSCFYTNMMTGKLDQMYQCLHCTFTESRDISLEEIPTLLSKLQKINSRGQDINQKLQSAQVYHFAQQRDQIHLFHNVKNRIAKINEKNTSANNAENKSHFLSTSASNDPSQKETILPTNNDDTMDLITKQRQNKRSRA